MLENNASFSLYMAFGGTTFGFDAGANAPSYKPVTTSYDYDAPIDEAGRPTTKYAALRELLSAHVSPGEKPTPPVPATQPAVTFPPFALREVSPLTDNLPAAVESDDPMNFESLDVPQGSVLYRTTLPAGPAAKLEFTEVNDYAIVTIAGQRVGVLDRRHEQRSIDLPARDASQPIDVLVHAFGHVNFGDRMGDRKGIAGPRLKAGEQVTPLKHWQQFKLPMSAADVTAVKFRDGESSDSTAFYRGTFHLPQAGDTYLHTRRHRRPGRRLDQRPQPWPLLEHRSAANALRAGAVAEGRGESDHRAGLRTTKAGDRCGSERADSRRGARGRARMTLGATP